jgi:UDP-2,4-diacetamido-2,4,6-trideoxy-beta-L-altropyranose hydrolase
MTISSAKTLTVAPQDSGSNGSRNLWIWTAAGPQIGFGHLKRCCILAKTLRHYCHPLFLVDSEDNWSIQQLAKEGWDYCRRMQSDVWSLSPDPVGILIDTRLNRGLNQLIAEAKTRRIPVISIHDLGLNPLPSDIIVDGSIAPLTADAAGSTACYSGTDYMVLDPQYGQLHSRRKQTRKRIRSVFVNLGGGNSQRYFLKVLQGLKLWSNEVEIIGVPGFVDWGQETLSRKGSIPSSFHWETRNVDRRLFHADLAITAGGLSAYEALCAGTPLMCLSHDPLQQTTILALAGKGACIDLGPGDELNPAELSCILSQIDLDVAQRKSLSIQGRLVVDGRGAERVAEIIRQSIRFCSAIDYGRASDAARPGF